ncbi:transposable element Tcb2 transposase [Trichonephila clavipes]|nr:transposable element Tcb2 transposase [Trichonephila clavipes]
MQNGLISVHSIQHVWDAVKGHLEARCYPPDNLRKPKQILLEDRKLTSRNFRYFEAISKTIPKALECNKMTLTVFTKDLLISVGRRPGQGRRRATTPNENRYLVLKARTHRNMNATLLQKHLRSATGTTVSTQTVRNRLHGVVLYAR